MQRIGHLVGLGWTVFWYGLFTLFFIAFALYCAWDALYFIGRLAGVIGPP